MTELDASCHCGKVRFSAPAPTEMTRCNCTYCDRVGALWGYCGPDDFRLTSDPANLLVYAPTQGEHYSCATCGMVTHGLFPDYQDPDSDRQVYGYNVRMDVDFDRSSVKVIDLDGRHQW